MLAEAQAAIDIAQTRDTENPAIPLEAGVIAVLSGREADARAQWQKVTTMAPDSSEAASARSYMAQIGAE